MRILMLSLMFMLLMSESHLVHYVVHYTVSQHTVIHQEVAAAAADDVDDVDDEIL